MPVVFDSSALLAIAFDESGAEVARTALKEGILSAVNASEVVSRFVDLGVSEKQAREWLMKFGLPIRPFDEELAVAAGILRLDTKKIGLSLGDRACLALALREGCSVITADRNWNRLDLGVEIEMVR